MITEKLHSQGQWTISLKEDAPESLTEVLEFAGHVVITTERVDHEAMSDADLRDQARWMGVLTHRPTQNNRMSMKGRGLIWWLGDHENRGKVFRGLSTLEFVGKSWDDGWTDILATPTPITKGTIEATGGTYTHTFDLVTQRQAAERFAAAFGAEFRINRDFTLDAGASGFLYNGTPTAVIARKFAGDDPEIDGLVASLIDSTEDIEDFISTAVVAAQGTGDTLQTAEQSLGDKLFKDPQGNDIDRTKVFNDPATATGDASSRAQQYLDEFGAIRKIVKLNLEDFHIKGEFEVGDLIYVWDPKTRLRDTANESHFRGQVLNPIAIRVVGMSWPILRGMGVYYRDENGSYTDLTDYVEYGSQNVTVEVGASSRNLVSGTSEALDARITLDPDGNDVIGPAQPTHKSTPWATFQDVSSQGIATARIVVEWNEPDNTDASTVEDGLGYNIRYRRQGETEYSTQFAAWGVEASVVEGLTPGVTYELNVEAGDTNANWSGFGTVADEVVVAATDVGAPSQPTAPTLAANPLRAQITHDLQAQGGGDLEDDLDHLKVYMSTSSGFTPSASNLITEVPVTAAQIALGIDVVASFPINDDTLRYVKVTAVDRDGNESTPSNQATVTATLIDTQHIENLAVTNAKIDTVTASKLTAGTIGAHTIVLDSGGEIESNNFVAGTSGWQIDGNGNAEFNSAIFRGDIESGNWDGTSPANLATIDSGATAGFYWDSSVGSGQFMGDLFVGGDIELLDTGTITTDTSVNATARLLDVSGTGTVGVAWAGTTIMSMRADSAALAKIGLGATGNDYMEYGSAGPSLRVVMNSSEVVSFEEDGTFYSQPIHTGGTTWIREPWDGGGIEFSTGMIGSQGAFRFGLHWNYERGTDSGWYAKALNSFTSAGAVEIGNDGILFRFDASYGATTIPTQRWKMDHLYFGNGVGVSATNNTERIALAHSSHQIQVNKNGNVAAFFGRADTPTNGGVVDFRRAGTQVGSIALSAGSTSYNVSSDRALKKNIKMVGPGWLDRLMAIPVRSFDLRGKENPHTDAGYIAQEVYEIYDDPVSPPSEEGSIEHWQMDYGRMTPLIHAATQELNLKLERELALLHAEIEMLKAAA